MEGVGLNILLYTWFPSYTDDDLERKLKECGHRCLHIKDVGAAAEDRYENEPFCRKFKKLLSEGSFDCVFTTNFFPLIARVCHEEDVLYISWSYDSPPNLESLRDMDHSTNRIFFFSMDDVKNYRNEGLDNIYHMPLAVDTDKWDRIKAPAEKMQISLVGRLCRSTLPVLLTKMSKEQQQFFKTLSDIQLKTPDKYLLSEFITDGVAGEICSTDAAQLGVELRPNRKQLIYSVASYVTHIDRLLLLKKLSEKYDTHLFTSEDINEYASMLPDVKLHGQVSYEKQMPEVFKGSLINLCPIFRGNISGIPLRIMDVMGCRAFVMSSYCPELAEEFKEGREAVMYKDAAEALEKAAYYLSHEDERTAIAAAGYELVKKSYSYEGQLEKIFRVVFK